MQSVFVSAVHYQKASRPVLAYFDFAYYFYFKGDTFKAVTGPGQPERPHAKSKEIQ